MANELPKRLEARKRQPDQKPTEATTAYDQDGVLRFWGDGIAVREAVRRWNAHEALVEVAKRLVEAVDLLSVGGMVPVFKGNAKLISKARAALEAAKEKP